MEYKDLQSKRDQLQSRLNWLTQINTLHRSVEMLFVVDGYEITVTWDGHPISPDYHGKTIEDAIANAMAHFDMDGHPRWREE